MKTCLMMEADIVIGHTIKEGSEDDHGHEVTKGWQSVTCANIIIIFYVILLGIEEGHVVGSVSEETEEEMINTEGKEVDPNHEVAGEH